MMATRPPKAMSSVAMIDAAPTLASDEAAYITGVTLPVSGGIWPALP